MAFQPGRIHRAPRYLSWLKEAGWEIVLQKPVPVSGSVRVNISAGRPDRRKRDIDNLCKALLDLLVAHRVIEDDSLVAAISSKWDDNVVAGRVHVEIRRARVPEATRSNARSAGARPLGAGARL